MNAPLTPHNRPNHVNLNAPVPIFKKQSAPETVSINVFTCPDGDLEGFALNLAYWFQKLGRDRIITTFQPKPEQMVVWYWGETVNLDPPKEGGQS